MLLPLLTRSIVFFALPLFGLLLLPFSDAALARPLRVATYNVWGLPAPVTVMPSRFKDIRSRVPALNADVIAFQETFAAKSKILAELPGYPYFAWGTPGRTDVFGKTSDGLLIISKYPIVESNRVTYSECKGNDCFAHKGGLHARVRLPDGLEVDFFTTHLNAGIKKNEALRVGQIQELSAFVRAHTSSSRPFIMLGDFNTNQDSPTYREIVAQLGVRDAHDEYRRATPGLPSVVYNGFSMDTERNGNVKFLGLGKHFAKPMRIDYVWLGNGAEVNSTRLIFEEKVSGRWLSDHFGIVADLDVQ